MNVVSVTQLEKDTLMVVYDSKMTNTIKCSSNKLILSFIISKKFFMIFLGIAKFVNINGKVKSGRKTCSEIKFDFQVDSVGK